MNRSSHFFGSYSVLQEPLGPKKKERRGTQDERSKASSNTCIGSGYDRYIAERTRKRMMGGKRKDQTKGEGKKKDQARGKKPTLAIIISMQPALF